MAEEFSIEGKKHMITLSIGISLYPKEDSKSLLTSADSAVLSQKISRAMVGFILDKLMLQARIIVRK